MKTAGSRVADVLGVRAGEPVRWERPMLYFMALIASGVVGWLVVPLREGLERGRWDASFAIMSDWSCVQMLARDLLYASLIPLTFRFVRNPVAAAAAAAVVAGPLLHVIAVAAYAAQRPRAEIHFELTWMGVNAIFVLVTFLAFEGGLRLARRRWLGLLLGTTIGAVAAMVVDVVLQIIRRQPVHVDAIGTAVDLIPRAVFVLVLAAGLAVASPDDDSTGHVASESGTDRPLGFHTGAIVAVDWTFLLLTFESVAGTIAGAGRYRGGSDRLGSLILSLAMLALLTFRAVVFCKWLYRVWSAIQDDHSRITPGRAVGLLFVPFFNFYWAFRAIAGIPGEYNAFVARRALVGAPFLSGPFKAYVLLVEATAVPLVGFVLVVMAVASHALSARDAPDIMIVLMIFGGLASIGACLVEAPMFRSGGDAVMRLRAIEMRQPEPGSASGEATWRS